MDKLDAAWQDATAQFGAILSNLTSALELDRPLPPITLRRTPQSGVTARIRRTQSGRVFIDLGDEFLYRLLNLIELLDDAQLTALLGADRITPPDADRLEAARVALYGVAEQFVLHHELFHLLCGHLDQQPAESSGRALSLQEMSASARSRVRRGGRADDPALRLYVELEADNTALQFLVDRCIVGDLAPVLPESDVANTPLSTLEGPAKAPAFRLTFAAVWLVLWLFEDLRCDEPSESHPWPAARLMALFFTLLPYYADLATDPADSDEERFATLTAESATLATEYMIHVVSPAMKFVVALADDDEIVRQYRDPDLSRSSLFADVLLDLRGLIFGHEVKTPGALQLLALEGRRSEFMRLFEPYRYFRSDSTSV